MSVTKLDAEDNTPIAGAVFGGEGGLQGGVLQGHDDTGEVGGAVAALQHYFCLLYTSRGHSSAAHKPKV